MKKPATSIQSGNRSISSPADNSISSLSQSESEFGSDSESEISTRNSPQPTYSTPIDPVAFSTPVPQAVQSTPVYRARTSQIKSILQSPRHKTNLPRRTPKSQILRQNRKRKRVSDFVTNSTKGYFDNWNKKPKKNE